MKVKTSEHILTKISTFIIKARYFIFALFIGLTVAGIFGMRLVKVNNDMTSYLPPESETRLALDIMGEEFIDYGSTEVMIKDTTISETNDLIDRIYTLDNIGSISYNPDNDYIDGKSLISITLSVDGDSDEAKTAIKDIRNLLEDEEVCLRGSLAQTSMFSEMMASQMLIILAIAVVIILTVLTVTSKSFFEIPIFILTFVVAAILNMGTNFMLGTISFITNSVAVILQLALAIDYAIIVAHRYAEECETKDPKSAVISAVSRSIPSILASSLTTISGLVAIMFMQFRIGFDIGIVLTKGIVCSFLTVFLLMPGLLYVSSGLIKKTRHKNYVPSVKKATTQVLKARKVLPIVGLVLVMAGLVGQSFLKYTFNSSVYPTSKTTAYNKGVKEIEETFGASALQLGIIVENGDYAKEKELSDYALREFGVDNGGIITSVISFGSLTGGRDPYAYYTPSEANAFILDIAKFASSMGYIEANIDDMDFSEALSQAYFAYNIKYNNSPAFDVQNLRLNLFDNGTNVGVLTFVVTDLASMVNEDTLELINTLNNTIPTIEGMLEGKTHARILLTVKEGVKSESKEAFDMVRDLRKGIQGLNLYEEPLVFGDMVSYYDIAQSFNGDRTLVNVLTVVFILAILLISFRSISLPAILILVIQGAIWVNFSIYAITSTPMLFMSYLIVSAINMGATIDYAIVVTNRYRELRAEGVQRLQAGIDAVTHSFSAILTSSTIMIVSGFVISIVSTEPYIFTIGMVLGSGTIISLLLVLFILPSLLIVFDKVINYTTLGGKKQIALDKEMLVVTTEPEAPLEDIAPSEPSKEE